MLIFTSYLHALHIVGFVPMCPKHYFQNTNCQHSTFALWISHCSQELIMHKFIPFISLQTGVISLQNSPCQETFQSSPSPSILVPERLETIGGLWVTGTVYHCILGNHKNGKSTRKLHRKLQTTKLTQKVTVGWLIAVWQEMNHNVNAETQGMLNKYHVY